MAILPERRNAKENVSGGLKTKPDDGSSFFASQNAFSPNAANQNNLPNRPANDNFKKRPTDGDSVIQKKIANDNTKNQNGTENLTENQKNIPKGIPTTQRGGAPVIQNPSAVSPETATTLPKDISESLQNQTLVRKDKKREGEINNSEISIRNYEGDIQNLKQDEINNQIQEDEYEEQNAVKKINPKVDFPWLMIILTFFEWIGVLVLSLMATVLGIFLLPVGVAIETFLEFWKLGFGVFINFWMLSYEKKYLNKYSGALKKGGNILKLIPTKKLLRRSILGFQIIPIVGDLIPVNLISVYMTYREVKKQFKNIK